MNYHELLNRVRDLSDQASARVEEYSGVIGSIKGFIMEHFGTNGLYAAYIILLVFALLVVSRLAKITFSTLKYLVVPAIALAFLISLFMPYSFAAMLPVTATFCSLFLLFKG